jgi:hypothetical protein
MKNKKTKTSLFAAGLFLVASSLNTYGDTATQAMSQSATADPYINVVKENTLSNMTLNITEDDIDNAKTIAGLQGTSGAEYYMLIGAHQTCVLSNALVADGNSHAGILMKITSGDANYKVASGADNGPGTAGVTQLALYNSATGAKIKFILVVTPGGFTQGDATFGSGVADGTLTSQYVAADFLIGGDATSQATATVYLHAADATSLASASTLENLPIDTYGSVNHFNMAPLLETGDISEGNGAANGLAAAENLTLTGCTGDVNPSDATTSSSALVTFKLYALAEDMANSPAGSYASSYSIGYADINDIGSGVVNEG